MEFCLFDLRWQWSKLMQLSKAGTVNIVNSAAASALYRAGLGDKSRDVSRSSGRYRQICLSCLRLAGIA
jgi:hypothetical protein